MRNTGNRSGRYTRSELIDAVGTIPRERIAHLPTPMEELPRLRSALGSDAPRLFVKRDDLTGLAFGGNKVRHLEFRIADMRARGADTIAIRNAAVSNHARLHTALAAKYGLTSCILKVPSRQDDPVNGNLLLAQLMGARIIEASSDDPDVLDREYREMLDMLAAEGRTVYDTVNDQHSAMLATCGYLIAAVEMLEQLEELGQSPDKVFIVSGASAAGLVLAGKLLGERFRVHGVNIGDQADPGAMMMDLANHAASFLGLDATITRDDFTASTEYGEPGYAVMGPIAKEAIDLAARYEALILDPVYTGKALSAVISEYRRGSFDPDDIVVFVHSGGTPNPFSYSDELLSNM